MRRIYFDESGQTGAHLLDRNQPYFTLGSTNISEAESAEIIEECFPRAKGPELKSRSLFRRESGRRSFISFAKVVGQRGNRFCGAKIDKRFSIICKMVDNLVEPMLRAMRYDFYADNYAARFANMANYAIARTMDERASTELLESYNTFARTPSGETLGALQATLRANLVAAPYGSEMFLSMMSRGADSFEQFHDLSDFNDTNDLHLTAVLQCMGFWQKGYKGPFEVVHDESTHFFKRSQLWKVMTNPQAEEAIIQVGDKTLNLPINVQSTTASRSHENASLQLCDLIAGFISFVSNPSMKPPERDFAHRAIDSGMQELSIFPVEPGTDFVDGPPMKSDGPDVIDRVINAVKPKRL
ncbi:DUF3800 domain-containing protein [Allorhizobium taibaishanense]|nr:DUF3800 domain-containing protein [Allorhizobium taibaishanense]MBB4010266.1 hypothetical protein [Allorhizobium taibaishanense]